MLFAISLRKRKGIVYVLSIKRALNNQKEKNEIKWFDPLASKE